MSTFFSVTTVDGNEMILNFDQVLSITECDAGSILVGNSGKELRIKDRFATSRQGELTYRVGAAPQRIRVL